MKKKYIIVFILLLLITGCKNNKDTQKKQYGNVKLSEAINILNSFDFTYYKSIEDFSNETKLDLAKKLYLEKYPDAQNLDAKIMRELYEKSFLGKMAYEDEDIKDYVVDMIEYKYNEEKDLYEKMEVDPHGFLGGIRSIRYDYDTYKENKVYYVITYNAYYIEYDIGPNPPEYYGKYEDAIDEKNVLFKNHTNPNFEYEWQEYEYNNFNPIKEEIIPNFNQYKDKLTKITYAFKKEDGNVYLIEIKEN